MNRSEASIELPEGAVENLAILIVQYMDRDGEMGHAIHIHGDVPLSSFIGAMEVSKYNLMEENND